MYYFLDPDRPALSHHMHAGEPLLQPVPYTQCPESYSLGRPVTS